MFVKASSLSAFWEGEVKSLSVGGRKIFLVDAGDGPRAYEDRCAHLGLPLSGGRLTDHVLRCPNHHWEYDVRTGRGVNPAEARLKPLAVRVEGDEVWVDVGEAVHG